MKHTAYILITFILMLCLFSSCTNHEKNGNEYYELATEAVNNDRIIQAYSLIEKAIEEYAKGKVPSKEYKARIFLSLLYFSTGQKDTAYEVIKNIEIKFPQNEDYPLYSNYYRIKAYYTSLYENNTKAAVALMDSVLLYDSLYASDNLNILNLDRLNKCEILLNGSQPEKVQHLIHSVIESTNMPSSMEPQIYANLARYYDYSQKPDSAYKYARLAIDKTSKIYEDIDNNIYALDIILQYDSINNNMCDYIYYRNMLETLKDERQGERIKYAMSFTKEQNISETLRIKAHNEKKTLIWICLSIFLGALIIFLFLRQRHKEAILKNKMIQLECDRLDAEAFRRKLENELLQRKINAKSDELTKANNEILELSQQLVQKSHAIENSDISYLQKLLDNASNNYPNFQKQLVNLNPDITKAESILATLIKLNLSSEEITTAMSISKSGLIKARYRLRKRLGIESSAELDNYISNI